ncbi:hypothetical protein H2200_005310 [Cladophialophora chaetospira]|uniref:Lysine-specific metallo-endopeptidase domain-containing protein n=1 Tax=Cladophialophora chaetospira TaxID=386627 RepID=A0AA38XBR3_9EURO|nr:hypothetical protein H2200_005310 [Cladophialophora chaetospira]
MEPQPLQLVLFVLLLLPTPLLTAPPHLYIDPAKIVSEDHQGRFQQAWLDCLTLARHVATTFDPVKTPTKANIKLDEDIKAGNVARILSSTAVTEGSPKFEELAIKLGVDATMDPEDHDECLDPSKDTAAFTLPEEEERTVVLCNSAFLDPSLDEIFDPPHWGKDTAGRALAGFNCDEYRLFLGAILLHEITHWGEFFWDDLLDWNNYIQATTVGTIEIEEFDGPGPPPGGYGPLKAQELQFFASERPDLYKPYPPLNNADSFAY